LRRPRGNEYRGAADLRCRGFTPGTQFRTGAKAGYLASRSNTRFTGRGPGALAPRSRNILGPAAICLNNVAPSACSSAIVGAISAALADARCWRAVADCMRIFTVGSTPRLPLRTAPLGGGDRRLRARAAHAVLSTKSLPLAVPWHRLPGISSASTRRHRSEPASASSRCN
jgi:hypothetical protein